MKHIFLALLSFLCLSIGAQDYRIYGGKDYKVYLGKWASQYDSESIWNNYGSYGSKYRSESIWNEYGTFGSKYNQYSPWNEYTSYPPRIIDERNNIVDYLTTGYKASVEMRKIVKFIIEHFDEAADDPSAFYKKYIE